MRSQVSLLLAHGHPDARRYPVGLVWDEASMVISRINGMMATEAVLLQTAVSSILSKESGEHFNKLVKQLGED